jgi:hypothetical protein
MASSAANSVNKVIGHDGDEIDIVPDLLGLVSTVKGKHACLGTRQSETEASATRVTLSKRILDFAQEQREIRNFLRSTQRRRGSTVSTGIFPVDVLKKKKPKY